MFLTEARDARPPFRLRRHSMRCSCCAPADAVGAQRPRMKLGVPGTCAEGGCFSRRDARVSEDVPTACATVAACPQQS